MPFPYLQTVLIEYFQIVKYHSLSRKIRDEPESTAAPEAPATINKRSHRAAAYVTTRRLPSPSSSSASSSAAPVTAAAAVAETQ